MTTFDPHKFERYMVYPNESIDRLTTNRTFQRLYEDVEKRMSLSNLALRGATDTIYGKAKFSSLTGLIFDEETLTTETSADYYGGMLTIDLLKKYSDSLSDNVSSSVFWSPSSVSHGTVGTNNYWIKTDYCNVDFSYLPNGINCITGTLELGFNNIPATFGNNSEVLSGDIMFPTEVSGYETYVNITKEDISNLNDYISFSEFGDREDVKNLTKLDGVNVTVPFVENCEATLKHNICNWTTYSSYKQSVVELHYTTKIDIRTLYELKYGKDTFETHSRKSVIDSKTIDTRHFDHPSAVFTQKPITMMQVGFYGGDASISPLFGFDNRASGTPNVTSDFYKYDTISLQPLTLNSENEELSPVEGMVMVKKFENEYNDDGLVTNNTIHFDVIMKFSVGSAADPKMIYGLTSINSRAKVQFAIIGV